MIRPCGDRILVEPHKAPEKTEGGIVLPDSSKEKPMRGGVKAVGPGTRNAEGVRQTPDFKVGDVVIYARYAGTEVEGMLLLQPHEILAWEGK